MPSVCIIFGLPSYLRSLTEESSDFWILPDSILAGLELYALKKNFFCTSYQISNTCYVLFFFFLGTLAQGQLGEK